MEAASGFPGRRKKSVEARIEAIAQSAEIKTDNSDFPVPEPLMANPEFWAMAIKVWGEVSQVLKVSGRRRPGYRHALARYCIWSQLYYSSLKSIERDCADGVIVEVKKGDGNTVLRRHPALDLMSEAEIRLRLLDAEFGFTPNSDQTLERLETFNSSQGRLPFDASPSFSQKPKDAGADPFGLMNSSDSQPPAGQLLS
jgi:P27 family predicted phage terminase small subunit